MMKIKYLLIIAAMTAGCNQQMNDEATTSKAEQQGATMQDGTETIDNTQNSLTEPEAVVRSLIEAMQNKDAEKIRSSFASNATQAYGDEAPKSADEFFSWLDSDIIDRSGRVSKPKYTVDGNEVVVTGRYFSWFYTSKANFLFTVDNGKIISWQMRY